MSEVKKRRRHIHPDRLPVECDDGSFRVLLTRGMYAKIDPCDVEMISGHVWHAAGRPGFMYAVTRVGKKQVKMHRMIMGDPEGLFVDHINSETMDNRRSNLRVATRRENAWNRSGLMPKNTSGYLGVTWHKINKKWSAVVSGVHVGYFDTAKEAAVARDKVAIAMHGEFATLNQEEGENGK